MNSLVYVIFFLTALLVVAILVINLAAVLTTRRLNQHFNRAVQAWREQNIQTVYGPALANLLNARHSIGADGNGALIMTTEALRFSQLTRSSDIVIPLSEISEVMLARSFNGRHSPQPFLIVKNRNGELTGFQTAHPEKWVEKIRPDLASGQVRATEFRQAAQTLVMSKP